MGLRFAMIKDNAGNLIQLFEYLPAIPRPNAG